VQSSNQIITTNKPTSSFLQAGCPSCRPTNSVKALKGTISHPMDLLTPSSPGGLPTLSLTNNSSWLHRGRVAMPLISPRMPVPMDGAESYPKTLAMLPSNNFADQRSVRGMHSSESHSGYYAPAPNSWGH